MDWKIRVSSFIVAFCVILSRFGSFADNNGGCVLTLEDGITELTPDDWTFTFTVASAVRDDVQVPGTVIYTFGATNVVSITQGESTQPSALYEYISYKLSADKKFLTVEVGPDFANFEKNENKTNSINTPVAFTCSGPSDMKFRVTVEHTNNNYPKFGDGTADPQILSMPYPNGLLVTTIVVTDIDLGNEGVTLTLDAAGDDMFSVVPVGASECSGDQSGKNYYFELRTKRQLSLDVAVTVLATATDNSQGTRLVSTETLTFEPDRDLSTPPTPRFDRPVYMGNIVENNQPGEIQLQTDIQFEEGYDAAELSVSLIEGINVATSYFEVTLVGTTVKLTLTSALPDEVYKEAYVMLVLEAVRTNAAYTGKTVIHLELPIQECATTPSPTTPVPTTECPTVTTQAECPTTNPTTECPECPTTTPGPATTECPVTECPTECPTTTPITECPSTTPGSGTTECPECPIECPTTTPGTLTTECPVTECPTECPTTTIGSGSTDCPECPTTTIGTGTTECPNTTPGTGTTECPECPIECPTTTQGTGTTECPLTSPGTGTTEPSVTECPTVCPTCPGTGTTDCPVTTCPTECPTSTDGTGTTECPVTTCPTECPTTTDGTGTTECPVTTCPTECPTTSPGTGTTACPECPTDCLTTTPGNWTPETTTECPLDCSQCSTTTCPATDCTTVTSSTGSSTAGSSPTTECATECPTDCTTVGSSSTTSGPTTPGPDEGTISFEKPLYEEYIEPFTVGIILTVKATADPVRPVIYSIESGSALINTKLSVDSSGNVAADNLPPGNYRFNVAATVASTSLYTATRVNVFVNNGMLCGTEVLFAYSVLIADVTENIEENVLQGMTAADGTNCVYTLTEGEEYFTLDADTGALATRGGKIDREDPQFIGVASPQLRAELNVVCDDVPASSNERVSRATTYDWALVESVPNRRSDMVVIAVIQDVNDNAPVFVGPNPLVVGYPSESLLSQLNPSSLVKVQATDADIDVNAELLYTLVPEDDPRFYIHPTDGTIYVMASDVTFTDQSLRVQVMDKAGAPDGLASENDLVVQVKILSQQHVTEIILQGAVLEDVDKILEDLSTETELVIRSLSASVLPSVVEETGAADTREKRDIEGKADQAGRESVLRLVVYAIDDDALVTSEDLMDELEDFSAWTIQEKRELEPLAKETDISGLRAAVITLGVIIILMLIGAGVTLYIFYVRPKMRRNAQMQDLISNGYDESNSSVSSSSASEMSRDSADGKAVVNVDSWLNLKNVEAGDTSNYYNVIETDQSASKDPTMVVVETQELVLTQFVMPDGNGPYISTAGSPRDDRNGTADKGMFVVDSSDDEEGRKDEEYKPKKKMERKKSQVTFNESVDCIEIEEI